MTEAHSDPAFLLLTFQTSSMWVGETDHINRETASAVRSPLERMSWGGHSHISWLVQATLSRQGLGGISGRGIPGRGNSH